MTSYAEREPKNESEAIDRGTSIVPRTTEKSANLLSRLVNKAVQRVTESIDNGRKVGENIVNNNIVGNNSNSYRRSNNFNNNDRNNNSNNNNQSRNSHNAHNSYSFFSLVGGVTGEVAGVCHGIIKAGLGVPLDIVRDNSRHSFLKDLDKYGPVEIEKILHAKTAFTDNRKIARVVAIRHGHAHHNDMGGLMSPFKRDPFLTSLGREEASITSTVLLNANIKFDHLVVSPFTRCLETASIIIQDNIPTKVSPLAGEHNGGKWKDDDMNKATSVVARGDHGSNRDKLLERFPPQAFPQYTKSINNLRERWWAHGQRSGFESYESYTERSMMLKKWIGQTYATNNGDGGKIPIIALVAHGGILTKTFTAEGEKVNKFNNCEFRVFDIDEHGNFLSPKVLVAKKDNEGTVAMKR